MSAVYQKLGLYIGMLFSALPVAWAAAPPVVVPIQPQTFSTDIQQNTLLEIFQSEADAELPWASIALSKTADDSRVVPVAWHVQWRREPGWPDPFSRDFSDHRQQALVSQNPDNTRYTPQGFLNGVEWRDLLNGTTPPISADRAIGELKVEIFPSGAIDLHFEPGGDFRHLIEEVSAHMVRLIEPEARKIPSGPAKGVIYQASHSVIDYQRTDYEPARQHWRFKLDTKRLWPDDIPEPRLVFWLESRDTPRPLQALAVQVRPKPPPPPIDE